MYNRKINELIRYEFFHAFTIIWMANYTLNCFLNCYSSRELKSHNRSKSQSSLELKTYDVIHTKKPMMWFTPILKSRLASPRPWVSYHTILTSLKFCVSWYLVINIILLRIYGVLHNFIAGTCSIQHVKRNFSCG